MQFGVLLVYKLLYTERTNNAGQPKLQKNQKYIIGDKYYA